MSSFVLNRYVGPEFDKERYEQVDKVARWLYEVDNAPDEKGFTSKLKRFWKRIRIPSVVKEVVTQSKSFLSSLASRLTPDGTPPESERSENKYPVDGTKQVNVWQENSTSPVSRTTVTSLALTPTSLKESALKRPAQSAASVPKPENCVATNHPTTNESTRGEKDAERAFSAFRYKEKEHGKQRDFPEVEIGLVSTRAKWLELFLSGKRKSVEALEMHNMGKLAIRKGREKVNQFSNETESDGESEFDDSPRLFKHRLPEEEPKPWIEPGTVAKGAMWLQPVMSGEKRTRGRDRNQGNLPSPTRVSHGTFR